MFNIPSISLRDIQIDHEASTTAFSISYKACNLRSDTQFKLFINIPSESPQVLVTPFSTRDIERGHNLCFSTPKIKLSLPITFSIHQGADLKFSGISSEHESSFNESIVLQITESRQMPIKLKQEGTSQIQKSEPDSTSVLNTSVSLDHNSLPRFGISQSGNTLRDEPKESLASRSTRPRKEISEIDTKNLRAVSIAGDHVPSPSDLIEEYFRELYVWNFSYNQQRKEILVGITVELKKLLKPPPRLFVRIYSGTNLLTEGECGKMDEFTEWNLVMRTSFTTTFEPFYYSRVNVIIDVQHKDNLVEQAVECRFIKRGQWGWKQDRL